MELREPGWAPPERMLLGDVAGLSTYLQDRIARAGLDPRDFVEEPPDHERLLAQLIAAAFGP